MITIFLRVNEFNSVLSTRSDEHCPKGYGYGSSASHKKKESSKSSHVLKSSLWAQWEYLHVLAGSSSNGNWQILLLAMISNTDWEAAELAHLLDSL